MRWTAVLHAIVDKIPAIDRMGIKGLKTGKNCSGVLTRISNSFYFVDEKQIKGKREGEWKPPLQGASPSSRIETSLPSVDGRTRKGQREAP